MHTVNFVTRILNAAALHLFFIWHTCTCINVVTNMPNVAVVVLVLLDPVYGIQRVHIFAKHNLVYY